MPWSPLRRLDLGMLFTSRSTSYQTTCTVSERSSIKGTCQCKPTLSSSYALRHIESHCTGPPDMRPHFTGTLLVLASIHQTWDLIVRGSLWPSRPSDMFKHVQLGPHGAWTPPASPDIFIIKYIVCKRAVLIRLECLSYYYDE